MNRLILICGATAVGKSEVAIRLALALGCPVVNCDSRQFYREMAIGTAVPTEQELATVPHYFIQDRSVTEPLSAGGYEKEALQKLEEIFKTSNTAILVGGSGLYINALLYGLDNLPSDLEVRQMLNAQGFDLSLEQLREKDPAYYNIVDRANPLRVIRALEVCLISGKPYSSFLSGNKALRPFSILKIGLELPREELYNRINHRVDLMIEASLEVEARNVLPFRDLSSLQTVGYREFFDYFDGLISYETAIELIKRNTRRYAKRQMTWMRPDNEIHWFAPTDLERIKHFIDANS